MTTELEEQFFKTYIKTYPYKLQCWIWAMLHKYINNGRNMYFKDERLDIREVEE